MSQQHKVNIELLENNTTKEVLGKLCNTNTGHVALQMFSRCYLYIHVFVGENAGYENMPSK